MRLIFTLLILCFTSPCLAAEKPDLSEFKKILIADQGRIKPLDTFSKSLLLRLSGQSKKHNEWLYETIFEPELSHKKEIFRIENPELKEALGLDAKKKRFSFEETQNATEKLFELSKAIAEKKTKDPNAQLTSFETQVINLRENIYSYLNISNSLLFALNHEDFKLSDKAKERLELKSNENSLYGIIQKSYLLSEVIAKIEPQAESITENDKELINLSISLYSWIENFRNFDELKISDTNLTIVPLGEWRWQSPWQVVFEPQEDSKAYLWHLDQAVKSTDNSKSFNKHLKDFNQKVLKATKQKASIIDLEILYNKLEPFKYTLVFYTLSLLLLIFTYSKKESFSLILSGIAFLLNTAGLVMRILIMQRPPVSNLYETFIFIAWAIALIGLIIFFIEKNKLGLLLSNICGFALILISFKFAAEGDTMQALIAVLDSNFWLSTHVIAITLGYAGVFAAGIIGHVYIFQKLLKNSTDSLKKTQSYLLGVLGFGLVMSFLGTLLGGIWADQSWGRFWGWDPKENGALLIVLWTALIFHARLSGFIKDIGLAQASIFGCIVVMLSWLGVNLLGVGLHSYGFTSGLFYALLTYSIIEVVFIISTALVLREKRNHIT